MKTTIGLLSALVMMVGCQNFLNPTCQPGIRYGMRKNEVIARISRTDTVISTDGDCVITEGIFDPSKQLARKTFGFQHDRLLSIRYVIIGPGGLGTNTSMTFVAKVLDDSAYPCAPANGAAPRR